MYWKGLVWLRRSLKIAFNGSEYDVHIRTFEIIQKLKRKFNFMNWHILLMFKEIVEIRLLYVFVKYVLFGFLYRGASANYSETEYG